MPQAKKETTPEVYLQKAVLEGYRTIKKLEVEFLPGLNVIIGKNGTGKTNLMEYLYRALNVEANEQLLNAEITLGKASSPEDLPLRIVREVRYETNESNILRSSQSAYAAQTRMSTGESNFKTRNHFIESYDFLIKNNYNYDAQLIKHGIPNNFNIFNGPFDYLDPSLGSNTKVFSDTPPLILRIILGQFLSLPQEEGKESVVKNKIKNVSAILAKIKEPLKYFSVIEDIRLSPSYSIYFDATLRSYFIKNVFVEYKVNNQWLPFNNLSDGTKRIFYVTAEVMAMDAYRSFVKTIARGLPSTKAVFANQIILLEEPELGLHPHQLADLMNFLKEQATHKQIIISTHSPIVLDSVAPDELDRIHIAELTPEGTQLRRLTPKQQAKAQIYTQETGLISDYWRFSDLEE